MTDATRQAKLAAGILSPDDVSLEDLDIDVKADLFLGEEDEYDLDDLLDDDEEEEDEEEDDEDIFVNDGS